MKIEVILPGIQKNILLKNYTTFKIGGPAKYFFVAKTKENLIEAIKLAKKMKLPFFVLGRGSNLLVADEGYKGLVIKIQNSKFKIQNSKITAEAGVMLSQLISVSINNRLTGLEWAAGIRGTIGGAIYGNAGAFGKSMKDVVKKVEVFNTKTEKIKIFKNKDCKFSYRNSIFRQNKNLIILSAEIWLKKGEKLKISQKIKEYLSYRINTQPLSLPSAGSIFKNPKGFYVAELIEKCGLKGKRIGKVKFSEKHANFIVNLGNGKARDVKKLINLAKQKVKKQFRIKLEEEIQFLGL